MKKLFFIFLPVIVMQSCNTNEPDHSMVSPLSAFKIDSLQISGKQVTATVTYTIGTPCWYYLKPKAVMTIIPLLLKYLVNTMVKIVSKLLVL